MLVSPTSNHCMSIKCGRCICFIPATHTTILSAYIAEIPDLTNVQKLLLRDRCARILDEYERRTLMYAWVYNIMRTLLTVGGVLVPALLSIQYMQTGTEATKELYSGSMTRYEFMVFWSTWVLSVLIGICTSLIAAFKIDRRYYILHTTLEVMNSEIHQFFALTGKYSKVSKNKHLPTHHGQLRYLFYSLEKLRLSQVQQEYMQFNEASKGSGGSKQMDDTAMNEAIAGLGPPPASPPGSPTPATIPVQRVAPIMVQPAIMNELRSRRERNRRTRSEGSIDPTGDKKEPPIIGRIGRTGTGIRDLTEYPSVSLGIDSEDLTPHDSLSAISDISGHQIVTSI